MPPLARPLDERREAGPEEARTAQPLPRRLSARQPATTRSRMRPRLNSKLAANTCICDLLVDVLASIPSPRLTNAMPSAYNSSIVVIRCLRFLPTPAPDRRCGPVKSLTRFADCLPAGPKNCCRTV